MSSSACSQTVSTGGLVGVVLDPNGAAIPGVTILLIRQTTSEEQSITTDRQGRFEFQFLSPGAYQLQASRLSFEPLRAMLIQIAVTETLRVELHLRLATMPQSITVSSDVLMVQTDSSSLGRVVNSAAVTSLPLVTRNYTQIAVLSPGVSAGVFNAGELGTGGMPLSQISGSADGIFVHGARSYDNNYQLDGISVNDLQGSGSAAPQPLRRLVSYDGLELERIVTKALQKDRNLRYQSSAEIHSDLLVYKSNVDLGRACERLAT
jgi:Carboxypeptidase regulatory-like domain